MGLIQSVIEKAGLPTVSISLLKEVTRAVGPPRALFVDLPLGYPLGEPGNPEMQERILLSALNLLSQPVKDPLIQDFEIKDL